MRINEEGEKWRGGREGEGVRERERGWMKGLKEGKEGGNEGSRGARGEEVTDRG